jgi:acyl carrier protein
LPRDGNLFLLGILDSLTVVTLVAELESELGRSIPVDELVPENFRTVEDIAALCTRLAGGDRARAAVQERS